MKTENVLLMKSARESLKGKWGLAIGGSVVYMAVLIASGMVPILGSFASIVIAGPMILGLTIFFLNVSRNQESKIEQLFKGFDNFVLALKTYLWMGLFVFLWFLLFIIPGIIATYSYAMTFYILADDNSIKARDAIGMSKKMMAGNKMKLFLLNLRFFGWVLLCLLTFGIGFLWLFPYINVSQAKFYDDLKKDQNPEEISKPTTSVEADLKNVLKSEE